jgi:predicted nucleotidyltransferase
VSGESRTVPRELREVEVEKTLNRLTVELKNAYGENLVALFLYGSAVSGDFHEKFSDLNILCVLRDMSADLLKKAENTITWFVRKGNPPPMFFTEYEIESSNDVFPIEFLDMQANHRVLFGPDILKDLRVALENHRLELEHELRSKFIGLRQNFLSVSRDPKAVGNLILRSLSAVITLFRHTLILMGETVPVQKSDIISMFCTRAKLDESLFLELLKLREEGREVTATEALPTFKRYFEEIAKMIVLVDQLPKGLSSSEGRKQDS